MGRILSLTILVSTLLVSSCGQKNEVKTTDSLKKGCFYTYNHTSSTLEWTAFKFTEKTGVKGTFNEVIVESPKGSDNPERVLSSLRFKLPTSTVETQNEERNGKISNIFFKTLSTDTIRGSVKQLNLKKGKAIIDLQMNGLRRDVNGNCTYVDGLFTFNASIDLNDWNGKNAVQALNIACKDLHTGSDGKSVLWSTIDLSFSTRLLSDCE
jgi:polyisoprenoid-binding protein YceI